ncbi:hypothetical protein LCGC14_1330920 [marine sediment metagenome]|uniref:Uncharacterized protein n=1 Tax=marine sediment metagenome TaxID=412755 RepID=A0A0F9NJ45_9ZZZZ
MDNRDAFMRPYLFIKAVPLDFFVSPTRPYSNRYDSAVVDNILMCTDFSSALFLGFIFFKIYSQSLTHRTDEVSAFPSNTSISRFSLRTNVVVFSSPLTVVVNVNFPSLKA